MGALSGDSPAGEAHSAAAEPAAHGRMIFQHKGHKDAQRVYKCLRMSTRKNVMNYQMLL